MKIINKFSSPNFSARNKEIEYIILHYTELDFETALDTLCNPIAEVSCHYLIKSTGEIFQLVEEKYRAWHAGSSFWRGDEGLNDNSIGIEIDNSGNHPFTEEQTASCVRLCLHLKQKYNLKSSSIIGHSDLAPSRKIDPGIFFEWEQLAQFGLGAWPSGKIISSSKVLLAYQDQGKEVLKLQQDLQLLGYKIELTGRFDLQTNYVVRAFQAHFNPRLIRNKGLEFYRNEESKYFWDVSSKAILEDLLKSVS